MKPSKGNEDGFAIKPNSTQQIVLMSMSTDNSPIEPVSFHAIDAETSTKLMINHFIRPFVVLPKESKKDLTTVLITAPGKDGQRQPKFIHCKFQCFDVFTHMCTYSIMCIIYKCMHVYNYLCHCM